MKRLGSRKAIFTLIAGIGVVAVLAGPAQATELILGNEIDRSVILDQAPVVPTTPAVLDLPQTAVVNLSEAPTTTTVAPAIPHSVEPAAASPVKPAAKPKAPATTTTVAPVVPTQATDAPSDKAVEIGTACVMVRNGPTSGCD